MTNQTARFKLIALDMDGTLLNRKQEISEQNRIWIQAALEAGVKVILATSRPINGVIEHAKALNLHLPVIVSNGSEVWKSPYELHSRHEMNEDTKRRMTEVLRKYERQIQFWVQIAGGQFDYEHWDPISALDMKWLQVAIRTEHAALLKDIYEEVRSWRMLEISNSHITNIECNPLGRTKGSGLAEVCGLLGFDLNEAIAVGDSLNDVSMIRAAGLGVAMGNAQERVKQSADETTLTNEEDGVAEVIKRYFFNTDEGAVHAQ
ncbi:Cof-type HAD-IIB family hydrolase [Paenibacillus thermotolerans]|uniref:Cof-type HAD-IIB family hydrolase n=1 Tax=Paenibacillus thermotolerans TaxID=3027807 RepID=UPI002367EF16|nr:MULTISPECIES: Cof-type HAD-IIB family hydrolase [unclassified Paenibacillus]